LLKLKLHKNIQENDFFNENIDWGGTRMELVKRTCKKSRQELLNKLLKEELEELRKKCFPWKRKSLLLDEVIIKEFDLKDGITKGRYSYENGKHIIQVNKLTICACQRMPNNWIREDYRKTLKIIIKHELIHAFVNERYEALVSNIEGKLHDASPVFLTVLNWCGGYSGYDCFNNFEHTDNYLQSLHCFNTFEQLDKHIIKMLFDYRNAIKDLEDMDNIKEFRVGKVKGLNSISNDFKFSSSNCGFNKTAEVKRETMMKIDGKYIKTSVTNRYWEIGCNITPEQITKLYNKKQDCYAPSWNFARTVTELINGEMKTTKILKESKNFGVAEYV